MLRLALAAGEVDALTVAYNRCDQLQSFCIPARRFSEDARFTWIPMSHVTGRRPDGRLILLLGALAACGPISIDMYLPSLPTIAQAFAIGTGAAQTTLTSFMFGFSIGMLLYGPLSDTYGRRPVLLGGIIMYALASIACTLSFSIGALVTFRFVQALGAGAASVLARAIARDAYGPTDAARVLSMLAIVTSIGPLLAPLIGGQLLLLGGWRVVFIALTLFGMVCAITAFLKVPETWPREKRAHSALFKSFAAYGRLLRDPVAWGHMLCGGMAFASMFAYITATPFVYIQYFHVSAQHYGFLFALNIVGIMLGNFMNTRLVGRLGSLPIISFAASVSCIASLFVCLVSLTGWGGLWSIVAGLFFVVGVVGLLSANCTTDLMHRYPVNAGAAAAVFGAVQLALGALSSLAVGLWQDGSPKGMGVVVGVAGSLCYVGRILVVRWHGTKAPVAVV
jgi:DHA1 family bicyclomycin/chloramphenicol resistance-like MFS transporter